MTKSLSPRKKSKAAFSCQYSLS